ncbi:MAG: arginine--tRNA ligase [Acetobacteraceae bacterium]
MTDLFAEMRARVLDAVRATIPDLPDDIAARIEVTPTREAAHGDMAANAALVAGKAARMAPAKLAAALVERLRAAPEIESAEVAGPGFINLRLRPAALLTVLPAILRAGEAYGDSAAGGGLAVNVEYVSANPTGPLHIGHCRGAVVGDALANLMAKAGYAVTKEYYVNDAGGQVMALAWAVYWRYLQAVGAPMIEADFSARVPGGLQYRGDYLIAVGEALAVQYGDSLAEPDGGIGATDRWIGVVQDFAVESMMRSIREDLDLLGVHPDVFTSERVLVERHAVSDVIAMLDLDGLIYEGVLDPPKGKTPEDWEPRPQTLFRATRFGDDVDRPLRKSDGSYTYFANDIAYHADKVDRGAKLLIDVLGADHGGYVSRIKAAVKAVSHGQADLEAVLCQTVHVLRGGVAVPMSKRAGTYVTLAELIEEVGRDAVRFTMLTRKADAQMEFDLDQVVAQTRDNPVFYVQYAHARCRSVLRAAAEMFGAEATADAALAGVALDGLRAEPELALIRRLAQWPRCITAAAHAREPHRIAFFLYDLAADFHTLWNRGKDDSTLRFLQTTQPDDSLARLALVAVTAIVIRSGLGVMGVAPVEEMR